MVFRPPPMPQRNFKTKAKGEGFEWLRALAEAARCGLIYCGDLTLLPLIGDILQLVSRTPHRAVIRSLPEKDVRAVKSGTGFDTPERIRILSAVAALPGSLRSMRMVLKVAADGAGADERGPQNLDERLINAFGSPRWRSDRHGRLLRNRLSGNG